MQVADVRGDGDDGVFVGNDDDVLSAGTVGTKTARTATPHLIAIALHPVAGFLGHTALLGLLDARAGIDALRLFLRHLTHPLFRNNLLTIPLALLQQQLTHLCQIFSLQVKTPTSAVDALWTFFPHGLVDVERLKQTGVQIIDHLLARYLLHNG